MKLACYIKKDRLKGDSRVEALLAELLAAGHVLYPVRQPSDVQPGTDALLSLGGDGTFLSAARLAVPAGVPVLGVNFGRLGFLSENDPRKVAEALGKGDFIVEERELLQIRCDALPREEDWPYALNEMSVSRVSASMLGVDVTVDGDVLPTYWADGLLVATSSGSTAYSLSVGGPICLPETKVFIVAPISPHNLNVRPLIVPESSRISIRLQSRDDRAVLTMDNRNYTVPADSVIEVCAAPLRLRRLRLGRSNFINALRTRLLWGEDVRNAGTQD
ncbi:MAG: NAD(+)/NADH kinase [Bacteroidales bacterium]|nr:NAD(+)/NADH kinase [Bacteroidales bacterium]